MIGNLVVAAGVFAGFLAGLLYGVLCLLGVL